MTSSLVKIVAVNFSLGVGIGLATALDEVVVFLIRNRIPTSQWPASLLSLSSVGALLALGSILPIALIAGMLVLGRYSRLQVSLRAVLSLVVAILAFFLAGYYLGGIVGHDSACSETACPAYSPFQSLAYGVEICLAGIFCLYFLKIVQKARLERKWTQPEQTP